MPLDRSLLACAMLAALSLTVPGCTSTSAPPAAIGRLNLHDEAARLIGALDLSERLRNAARDYLVEQMAHGAEPRPALQRWVLMQKQQGVAIRCRPDASAECVAGS